MRARLAEHVERLRKAVPNAAASWTRIENIHLTLKFFGDVAVERIPLISNAAERAVRQFSGFEITVGNTGVFPKPNRPQVLWIGINDPSGTLASLQKTLENEFAAKGFEKEDRAYRPHLTIARLRRPEGAKHLADAHLRMQFDPLPLTLNELILFRSELSSKGSKYTAISRHQIPIRENP